MCTCILQGGYITYRLIYPNSFGNFDSISLNSMSMAYNQVETKMVILSCILKLMLLLASYRKCSLLFLLYNVLHLYTQVDSTIFCTKHFTFLTKHFLPNIPHKTFLTKHFSPNISAFLTKYFSQNISHKIFLKAVLYGP